MRLSVLFLISVLMFFDISILAEEGTLQRKKVRAPECGEELFVERADPICGSVYLARRTPICGPEQYNPRRTEVCGPELYREDASPVCGGFVPASRYTLQEVDFNCPSMHCKRGGNIIATRDQDVRGPGRPGESEPRCRRTITCEIPAVINRCRRPDFGVELWNECRHENHGVEVWKECRDQSHGLEYYNTCRRREFGVELYKECEVFLTREEIEERIRFVRSSLEMVATQLIQNHGLYLSFVSSESGLACHIAKYEANPLFTQSLRDLKSLFVTLFGKEYNASAYQCPPENMPNIEEEICAAEDTSNKCRAVLSYRRSKEWIEQNIDDIDLLLGDLFAQRDAGIKARLEELRTELVSQLDQDAQ